MTSKGTHVTWTHQLKMSSNAYKLLLNFKMALYCSAFIRKHFNNSRKF